MTTENERAHRGQHQRCGADLRERPHQHEAPEAGAGHRQRFARRHENHGEEDEGEGQAEEEAHLRRPDGPDRLGQAALHGVARRLRRRSRERRRYPDPDDIHESGAPVIPMS